MQKPSKNAVSANIKHRPSIYFHSDKRLYVHMFDMVDTAFSYKSTDRLLFFAGILQGKRK